MNHQHHSSISITLILLITLLSSLSVQVSNAWAMPLPIKRSSVTSAQQNNHKFHLLPKRFRNKSQPNSDTERCYRNGVDDDELTSTTITLALISPSLMQQQSSSSATITMPPVVASTEANPTITATEASVRNIDLPKHSPPDTTIRQAKMLWDLELVLGRTCMIAAVMMLVGEVCFGFSPLFSLIGI